MGKNIPMSDRAETTEDAVQVDLMQYVNLGNRVMC